METISTCFRTDKLILQGQAQRAKIPRCSERAGLAGDVPRLTPRTAAREPLGEAPESAEPAPRESEPVAAGSPPLGIALSTSVAALAEAPGRQGIGAGRSLSDRPLKAHMRFLARDDRATKAMP